MTAASAAKSLSRTVVGLTLGIGAVIAIALHFDISWHQAFGLLRDVRPEPIIFAVFGAVVILGLQSLRWWLVMRPVLRLRYMWAFKAMMVGFLFNVLLPARGGDLLRVQYLGRSAAVSRAKLLGTEIVDFWGDKWGWVAAFPVVCFAGTPPVWLFRTLLIIGGVVVGVGILLGLMASRLVRRGPQWLINMSDGFAANHWRRLLLVETFIAPLPWLWETAVIMVASHAFCFELTLMQSFATLTAFNVAMAVPSPANVGSFEAGGTLALIAFGVTKDRALSFIFLYHLTQLIPGIIGGTLVLMLERETIFGRRGSIAEKGVRSNIAAVKPISSDHMRTASNSAEKPSALGL
jgi:glycosyltransferase 2 family protein